MNSMTQLFFKKLKTQVYLHYESIFNLSSILTSSLILRYTDMYLDCKRDDCHSTNFQIVFLNVNDFFSASYGHDTNCLKWKYFTQTFALLWLVLSLVCFINQLEDYIHQSYFFSRYKCIYEPFRKILVGLIFANYCSKIYSTFLMTTCGHMVHNMIWTSYLQYHNAFPFLENNIVKLKPILDRMNLNLIYVPNLRSKYILNRIANPKQIEYKKHFD